MKNVTIEVECKCCKHPHRVIVDMTAYRRWMNGELIQKAMPDVSPENRELLISGICNECFNEIFKEEEV